MRLGARASRGAVHGPSSWRLRLGKPGGWDQRPASSLKPQEPRCGSAAGVQGCGPAGRSCPAGWGRRGPCREPSPRRPLLAEATLQPANRTEITGDPGLDCALPRGAACYTSRGHPWAPPPPFLPGTAQRPPPHLSGSPGVSGTPERRQRRPATTGSSRFVPGRSAPGGARGLRTEQGSREGRGRTRRRRLRFLSQQTTLRPLDVMEVEMHSSHLFTVTVSTPQNFFVLPPCGSLFRKVVTFLPE